MSKKRYELKVYSNFTTMEGLSTPKEYLDKAKLLGINGLAVTDRMTVCGIYDYVAAAKKEKDFIPILGTELMVQNDLFENDFHNTFCVSLLAKNAEGMSKIYKLLTACAKNGKDSAVSLQYLIDHREDILIGSCCESGIFFHHKNNMPNAESFLDAAQLFDYIEVCPSMDRDITEILCMLGAEYNIPVCAVSDARYCYRAQQSHYHAICCANTLSKKESTAKHLCSAKQLENHFSYFEPERVQQIVYDGPECIAMQIERFPLFSTVLQSVAPQCEPIIDHIQFLLSGYFGELIPQEIADRVNEELRYFAKEGLFGHLQTLNGIYEKIGPCFVTGCWAYSYLTYLLGVSRLDPMEYDLSFDAFKRSKNKNHLHICCTDSGVEKGYEVLSELYSKDHLLQVSAFRTMPFGRFRRFYKQLAVDKEANLPSLDFEQNFDKLSVIGGGPTAVGTDRRAYLITPAGVRVNDVTAACLDTSVHEEGLLTSCKLDDLLGTGLTVVELFSMPMLDMLCKLEKSSKCQIDEQTPYVAETTAYLMSTIGREPEYMPDGSLGYLTHLFKYFLPNSFEQLVKLFSIGHSSRLWANNYDEYVRHDFIEPHEIFTDTDDLYRMLIDANIPPQTAADITNAASIGTVSDLMDDEMKEMLENAGFPYWFANILENIRRMHPKAYGMAEADIFCRLIWYRFHDFKLYRKICIKELSQ